MNEIKFEYLIGDESKFKDASEIVLAIIQYGKDDFVWLTELEKIPEVEGNLIAMRRVILPPVWTKADQQAGRLPEVGAKHGFVGLSGVFTCLFIDCAGFVWSFGENNEVYCSEDNALIALETDAERQQREEDEFVSSINVDDYSPLLSGVAFKTGVRAAYRKLKMPEVQK